MPEPIVTLNEESLRSDLRELVRKTVEDTLNGLLEAEADELVGAGRRGRTAERVAYRAGRYDRGPTTSSGEVTIHMPKLEGARLATATIERYRRRETSVEEAMIEMYLAGVSTGRIEDVSEILRGSGVSAATVSNLNEKAFAVADELERMRLGEAARVVREGSPETLAYTGFPREHRRRIRTNNAIERLNREVRRRTRVAGAFPDGKSALMLVTARLKYVAESEWGMRRYLDVTLLDE